VLALEGRCEDFTLGRDTEGEKVKEIYPLAIKHGMKLSAISGAKGVYTDEDIARVVQLAKKALPAWKGGTAPAGGKRPSAPKAAAKKTPASKVGKTAVKTSAKPAVKKPANPVPKSPVKAVKKAAPASKKMRVAA